MHLALQLDEALTLDAGHLRAEVAEHDIGGRGGAGRLSRIALRERDLRVSDEHVRDHLAIADLERKLGAFAEPPPRLVVLARLGGEAAEVVERDGLALPVSELALQLERLEGERDPACEIADVAGHMAKVAEHDGEPLALTELTEGRC